MDATVKLLSPVDMAIHACEATLSSLKRARQTNYPPAATAILWSAINDQARIKGFIDRELASLSSSWLRANPPGVAVPSKDEAVQAGEAEGEHKSPEVSEDSGRDDDRLNLGTIRRSDLRAADKIATATPKA